VEAEQDPGEGRPVGLVTGAGGDIGSAICAELLRRGFDVIGVDRGIDCAEGDETAEAVGQIGRASCRERV